MAIMRWVERFAPCSIKGELLGYACRSAVADCPQVDDRCKLIYLHRAVDHTGTTVHGRHPLRTTIQRRIRRIWLVSVL
jgi:hypothetical protein